MKKYYYKQTKKRCQEECFSASLAYIMGIHTMQVPFFVESKNWQSHLRRWLKDRGYSINWKRYKPGILKPNRLYIVQGSSPRNHLWDHAVVYRGAKKVYDPSPSFEFFTGKPKWVFFLNKILK